MKTQTINLVKIVIDQQTKSNINELLDSGQIAFGQKVIDFEKSFAQFCGVNDAVSSMNGTTALDLIWKSFEIKYNEKIITTPLSFIASVNSILFQRAIPIFADIDLKTYNLDPNKVEDILKKDSSIRYILGVNLYGLLIDIEAFSYLQKKYEVTIVEDAAQAHGAMYQNQKAGSFFDAAAFSFYATKNMHCGEGGMSLFKKKNYSALARKLLNHGRKEGYVHDKIGYNFRMTNIQACIGLASLKHNNELTQNRIKNAEYYNEHLHSSIITPYCPQDYKHVYHQYIIRAKNRDKLKNYLTKHNIQSAIVYPIALHQQESLSFLYDKHQKSSFPIAEQICDEVLALPIHPYLKEEEIKKVVKTINDFIENPIN